MKAAIILAAAPVAVAISTAAAQVVTDGTLGPQQALVGPTYDITQALGTTRGGNLFHSFSTFNLQAGETARFSGVGVNNVLARVTGGSASIIDGTIQSTINGANLYFINPAGVIFGLNAALDVPGSFVATTADFVQLEDGVRFGMQTPAAVLTSAPPEAFGFLGTSTGVVATIGSRLQSAPGQSLALVGGDVRIISSVLSADQGSTSSVSAVTGPPTP